MTLGIMVLLAVLTAVVLLVQRTPADGVTFASLYAFTLFVIPARFVVGPLGSVASPAVLVGLGALVLWALRKLHHPVSWIDRQPNPVRTALFAVTSYALLSAGAAQLRLLDEFETSGMARTVVVFISCVGIALLVADATGSLDRLELLVDRIVILGAIGAVFGLVQFALSFDLGNLLRLDPLLTEMGNADFSRSVFRRPSGAALHPISFAVVMSALLPLALHRFFYRPDRSFLSRGLPIALIGAGIPLSLSRTAFIAGFVGVGALLLVWDRHRRLQALVVGTLALIGTIFVPGLAGTLRDLILGASDSSSVQARVDDFPFVLSLVEDSPIIGRGFGSFTADGYRLLDNEFLNSLIEVGFLGVAIYAITLAVIVHAAGAPRRRGAPEPIAHLGQALIGTSLAIVSSVFTFDTFFFRTSTGLLMLSFGMIAVVWRLGHPADHPPPARGVAAQVASSPGLNTLEEPRR